MKSAFRHHCARAADNTAEHAIIAGGLRRSYGSGDAAVTALDGVDLAFRRGHLTAIMGPSGSGKSTLLHCLAGLDAPDEGSIVVGGTELTGLRDGALTRLRRDRFGFVFQAFNLLPVLDAAANITLPLDLAGRRPEPGWFDHVVDRLGLADRLAHRPHELSGGQQQRVAIARALVTRPDVVFADEPTGNLDSRSGTEVLRLLRTSARADGQTIVLVTHDPVAAGYADRVVVLGDGRVVADLTAPTTEEIIAVAHPRRPA
ncbi:MAG TPA: ABC transporter ATP-binding protein [Amycolatopsis sp.]|nr:ABC transporter ATP-binding protein [Amycolatopsis sp.]